MRETASVLDITRFLKSEDSGAHCEFDVPVCGTDERFHDVVFDGKFRNISGVLTLKATVHGLYDAVCDRCLRPFTLSLDAQLDTVVGENESKDDSVTVENGRMDLVKTCYDALSLELPTILWCKEGCKGVCPCCGADRNEGDCGCGASF